MKYTDVNVGKRRSGTETHTSKNRLDYLLKRDIAPLPPIVDPSRRKQCKKNFVRFVKTYFSTKCPDFTDIRLKLAKLLETSVLKDEQIVIGLPRGSGKSALSKLLSLWSIAYGHRKFVSYLCATEEDARNVLSDIRHSIQAPVFREDFPEMSEPFVAADYFKKTHHYQLLHGKPTNIQRTGFRIKFADIQHAASSSAVIEMMKLGEMETALLLGHSDPKMLRERYDHSHAARLSEYKKRLESEN